eukprot:899068-Pelagomonas_calceolata.AAC.1
MHKLLQHPSRFLHTAQVAMSDLTEFTDPLLDAQADLMHAPRPHHAPPARLPAPRVRINGLHPTQPSAALPCASSQTSSACAALMPPSQQLHQQATFADVLPARLGCLAAAPAAVTGDAAHGRSMQAAVPPKTALRQQEAMPTDVLIPNSLESLASAGRTALPTSPHPPAKRQRAVRFAD